MRASTSSRGPAAHHHRQAQVRPCHTATPFKAARVGRAVRKAATAPKALGDASAAGLAVATTLPLAAGLGLGIWKLVTYSQLEYITAAMLSKYVPRDAPGPRVIQLLGGTRELYYYPKNTVQVTVVGEKINKSLLEQAGMQAAVPTVAFQQSVANLGFQADSSVDAVVSLGAMAAMTEAQRAAFLQEALRVLKPGKPIIFIEKVPGGLPLPGVLSSGQELALSVLQGFKARTDMFQLVEWDIGSAAQDPHAAGIAVKSERYRAAPPGSSKASKSSAAKAQQQPAAAATVAAVPPTTPAAATPQQEAPASQQPAAKEKTKKPKKGFS